MAQIQMLVSIQAMELTYPFMPLLDEEQLRTTGHGRPGKTILDSVQGSRATPVSAGIVGVWIRRGNLVAFGSWICCGVHENKSGRSCIGIRTLRGGDCTVDDGTPDKNVMQCLQGHWDYSLS